MMPDRVSHYQLFDTTLGTCGVAWTALGLSRVQLPERDVAATDARMRSRGGVAADGDVPSYAAECMASMRAYMEGDAIDFHQLPLDLTGIVEQEQLIYATLRRVRWGETTTYGQLAHAIGEPNAARVVGRAMGRNPWPVVVPCHRVLTAQQTTGGFSAYGGIETKLHLLRLEGTRIEDARLEQTDLFA